MTIGCCPLKYYGLTRYEVYEECVSTLNNVLSNLMAILFSPLLLHFLFPISILHSYRLEPRSAIQNLFPSSFYFSILDLLVYNLMKSIRVWPHNLPTTHKHVIHSRTKYLSMCGSIIQFLKLNIY